jgi:ribosomal protein L31E
MKMWYIYTMEHCSAIAMNEIMSFVRKCMELEMVMLSHKSQTKCWWSGTNGRVPA